VRAALDLGDRLKTKVEFVHAVRVSLFEWMTGDPTRGPAAVAEAMKTASGRINEHVRSLIRPGSGRKAEDLVRVLPGVPAAVLLEEAREKKVDLVVLGSHRKRDPIDFGSTARAVLAKGNFPVWIQAKPARRIERILAPIDLSEDSLRALAFACTLAQALGASVRAVHFFDAASFYAVTPDVLGYMPAISVEEIREKAIADFDEVISAVDWQRAVHSAEFVEGSPAAGILDFSQSADLLVIGTHGRTGLASAVLGGIAHAVLQRSETPVLAIPYPGRKFLI